MGMAFVPRELFGGAIVAELPDGFLDASDLRQIPDHQEVYLSPKTLTSIVIEVNEYVTAQQTADQTLLPQTPLPSTGNGDKTYDDDDQRAVLYHLNDVISTEGSTNGPAPSFSAAIPVALGNAELAERARTWRVTARVETPVPRQGTRPRNMEEEALTVGHTQDPPQQHETTTIHFLLIRIARHQTDLCVQANVPWKELVPPQAQTLGDREEVPPSENALAEDFRKEETQAEQCLDRIVSSIEVREWGLFGND